MKIRNICLTSKTRFFRKHGIYFFCLLILLLLMPVLSVNASESKKNSAITQADNQMNWGIRAYNQGDFAEAIRQWEKAADIYEAEGETDRQIDSLSRIAEAYQAMGQYRQAIDIILPMISKKPGFFKKPGFSNSSFSNSQSAMLMGILGQLYLFTGDFDIAEEYLLHKALKMVRKNREPGIVAIILNNIGNLMAARKDYDGAVIAYTECMTLAKSSDNLMLAVKARINAAGVYCEKKDYHQAMILLKTGLSDVRSLSDSHDKAYTLIATGQLINRIRRDSHMTLEMSEPEMLSLAFEMFTEAQKITENLDDTTGLSYAIGYLGNLYEEAGKYDDALYLTRQAVFAAQKRNEVKSLYRWEWQTGRLLHAKGDIDSAISAYFRSIHSFESVRNHLTQECYRNPGLSFRDTIGYVYFELADLLLQQNAKLQNPEQVRKNLLKARSAIEQFKAMELQDYFQDECVTTLQTKEISVAQIVSDQKAALYPILLPDRMELLVNFSDELKQFTIPVGSKILASEIREFRFRLQDSEKAYLELAQKIYDYIIRPIEKDLENRQIKTLIFIPDGELRTIPLAALHDGKTFLVSKYAVVTTPGLHLIDPHPLQWKNVRILLNGLTESVQQFPPLPNVAAELDAIQSLYNCKILRDKDFTSDAVRNELQTTPFSVVHIASHGYFDKDSQKSFLLTYDGKLTMNDLEQLMGLSQFREEPVELLTLSACQTAVGDERAALGLAGVALRAGARSALASLWFINDRATSELVADFYRQHVLNPSISKAEALQQAQMNLLKQAQYQHPAYWAPFLLIGNWL